MFHRVLGLIAVTSSIFSNGVPSTRKPDYVAERTDRARELTRPYGWMSLVALKGLKPGITTVGSAADSSLVLPNAPAHLLQLEDKDGKVYLRSADTSLKLHDANIASDAEISPAEDDRSALTSGSLRLWVIKRGDQRYLRVKDSQAPALKHFHNLRWYAPNDHYRIAARWIVDPVPHKLKTINKLGQISETASSGHVEFTIDGKKQSLIPLEANSERLWFVFRDETFKTETDQGGRFLTVTPPVGGLGQNNEVEIDFNEAINPPCAYSPYATCPLASKENRLSVAILAGEKRYEP